MKCVSYTNRLSLAGDLKTHNFGGVPAMPNVYFGVTIETVAAGLALSSAQDVDRNEVKDFERQPDFLLRTSSRLTILPAPSPWRLFTSAAARIPNLHFETVAAGSRGREHDPLFSLADELRTHFFGGALAAANVYFGRCQDPESPF